MRKKINFVVLTLMMLLSLQMPLIAFAQTTSLAEDATSKKDEEQSKNIVDVVTGDDRFKTLSSALKAADLVDTLKGNGPFTVFAPTDEAFAKLPAGTVDDLLKPENKTKLVTILTYHVSNKKLDSAAILKLNGKEITTSNGKKAKITVKDDTVYIDNAKIITNDIMAKNGIIHIIDIVLLPE